MGRAHLVLSESSCALESLSKVSPLGVTPGCHLRGPVPVLHEVPVWKGDVRVKFKQGPSPWERIRANVREGTHVPTLVL